MTVGLDEGLHVDPCYAGYTSCVWGKNNLGSARLHRERTNKMAAK